MKKVPLLIFGMALILAFVWVVLRQQPTESLQHITGQTMGTIVYNVKFLGQELPLKSEIDQRLEEFNNSLSTYIPESEISRLNKTGRLSITSEFFLPVLEVSKEVFDATNGGFDPSIGPLVQAWGFGPNKQIPTLDSVTVDSLLSITGFEEVSFDSVSVALPENFELDFSAIAKGYAVDIVAELLEEKSITNYLVEIGGEVRCKGINDKNESWSLGIEDPTVESTEQRILAIVRLRDRALATSGNYRNYYIKEGRTYAHIINPRTGYNAQHTLLSASVFATNCMTADAYSTGLMVLGLEKSKRIIESTEDLDAILIYQNDNGELSSYVSSGIKPFIELNKTK